MRKVLLSIIIGSSIFNLVSCGNRGVDQNSISNQYPIEEYLEKGAILENYESDGTTIMIDTKGERFFVGHNSTYKVKLSEDGVILPYVVINDDVYYFKNNIGNNNVPGDLKKLGKISTFGGNLKTFIQENNLSGNYIENLIVYCNKKDSNLIYTTYAGVDGYQVWSK